MKKIKIILIIIFLVFLNSLSFAKKINIDMIMDGVNGATDVDYWWNDWTKTQESYYWKLNQIIDGFAIFYYVSAYSKEYLIAVEIKSLNKSKLNKGKALENCFKYLKYECDVKWKNNKGFDFLVKKYKAINQKEFNKLINMK